MKLVKRWKTTTLIMVAVVALAIPAAANATALKVKQGTLVPNGETFQAVSTNFEIQTSLGTLKCEKFGLNAKVTQNNGTEFAAVGAGEGFSSVCKLGSTVMTWKNIRLSSLSASSPTNGRMAFEFEILMPGLSCKYASKLGGTPVSYVSGGQTIHLEGPLVASPSACGTASVKSDFTLTGSVGQQLYIW